MNCVICNKEVDGEYYKPYADKNIVVCYSHYADNTRSELIKIIN